MVLNKYYDEMEIVNRKLLVVLLLAVMTLLQSVSPAASISIQPVINNKGVKLPSTGGVGTTIFYIIGGILILGAAIALIGKKKFAR